MSIYKNNNGTLVKQDDGGGANIFSGGVTEWNALSSAEQAQYDYWDNTDEPADVLPIMSSSQAGVAKVGNGLSVNNGKVCTEVKYAVVADLSELDTWVENNSGRYIYIAMLTGGAGIVLGYTNSSKLYQNQLLLSIQGTSIVKFRRKSGTTTWSEWYELANS